MQWQSTDKATTPGWYAILYCWDVQEGVHCGTSQWDGKAWKDSFPITGIAGPFKTEEEASAWADENDPDL